MIYGIFEKKKHITLQPKAKLEFLFSMRFNIANDVDLVAMSPNGQLLIKSCYSVKLYS